MGKRWLIAVAILSFAFLGCTAYVRPAAPPPRTELKPVKPHHKAVWVPGHWVWKGKKRGYTWVPGHWRIVRR